MSDERNVVDIMRAAEASMGWHCIRFTLGSPDNFARHITEEEVVYTFDRGRVRLTRASGSYRVETLDGGVLYEQAV